jgi:hypothetical protein
MQAPKTRWFNISCGLGPVALPPSRVKSGRRWQSHQELAKLGWPCENWLRWPIRLAAPALRGFSRASWEKSDCELWRRAWAPGSGRREVLRELPLEFGEVARDHRHVEASENGFLRLAVEQESEGCFETALRRMLARQLLASFSRHRDVVMGLPISLPDDHLEFKMVVVCRTSDLDHVGLPCRVEQRRQGFGYEAKLVERKGVVHFRAQVVTAIRARRMQKDQLQAGHTIPPSHNGRQASERPPCCHKEFAVAYLLRNLAWQ